MKKADLTAAREGSYYTIAGCGGDLIYMPIRNRGRIARFFIQLGAGLSNGYPLKDVLAFAFRWSLTGKRKNAEA